MVAPESLSYAQRAATNKNAAARALLETIERKQSNLCVSVDVTKRDDFIRVIDVVGPYVCLIKVRSFVHRPVSTAQLQIQTHVDILEDFDSSLIESLVELSSKHDFLIFEDRKFADIGMDIFNVSRERSGC